MIRLVFIPALTVLVSCSRSAPTEKPEEQPVARFKEEKLFPSDIRMMMPSGISSKDSLELVKRYIDKWATEELFYEQALENMNPEELDVDKEVERYRKDLVNYRYQVKLISGQLDTTVTDKNIETYYQSNQQNFLLKDNIVKVLYVKAPKSIPGIDKLKKLCHSTTPKDMEALKSMCIQFADNYYMNDSTWLLLDDLKKEINQLNELPDYNIVAGRAFDFEDSLSYYFLKIKDVKIKNSISPLNFERKNIRTIIINQRKLQLISRLKKDLLDRAKSGKELEVY